MNALSTCAILILLFIAPTVSAEVYKCTDAAGKPVYSDKPCTTDPDKMQKLTIRHTEPSADGSYQRNAAALLDSSSRQNFAYQEADCVRTRSDEIGRRSQPRINEMQKRIRALEADIARRNNNLAGATWESGLREEIAALHNAIATERASADQLIAGVRDRCREERERKESELDKKAEATAAESR